MPDEIKFVIVAVFICALSGLLLFITKPPPPETDNRARGLQYYAQFAGCRTPPHP